MSLSTEYRGYTIQYDENRDHWGCYDCGVSEPSLSKAKAKIDAMHLKLRKASAVEGYEIAPVKDRDGYFARAVPCKVIDYLGPKVEHRFTFSEIVGQRVASVAKRNGSTKASRFETVLKNIAPQTVEVHAAIAEANRLGEIAFEADRAFMAAVSAIPRMPVEAIQGLIAASEHKFVEGES